MKKTETITTKATRVVTDTVIGVDKVVDEAEIKFEKRIAPVREKLSRRFPTLFILATTLGVTATFTGFEQILLRNNLLQEYPWLILILGVILLFLTGTLYKRLG